MAKWMVVTLLLVGAHFAASYVVPLDKPSQATFGGLLRWAWPWSDGDSGPLGAVTVASGFPAVGFWIAVTAGGLLLLASMSLLGWWVPSGWWRALAVGGAVALIVLMALFFGPTKVLPIAAALAILAVSTGNRFAMAGT